MKYTPSHQRLSSSLVFAFTALLISAGLPAHAQSDLWTRKMVWSHEMTCYPIQLGKTGTGEYGSAFPMELRFDAGETREQQTAIDIQDARASGIDAFDIDIFTNAASIEPYLDGADSVDASLPAGDEPFLIAPTLDLSNLQQSDATDATKENAALSAIEAYCVLASSHPSAARQGDAFIIFNYGTSQLPASDWVDLRSRLASDGYSTYWVANLGVNGLASYNYFPTSRVTQYFPAFDAEFTFGNAGQWWTDLVSLFDTFQRPFAGGMMPGYDSDPLEGYNDADGTLAYRTRWQEQIQSNLAWTHVATWNGMLENTNINPSSDWNLTRSDITAFEAARFKGDASPFKAPNLYITTPKALALDSSSTAEALVLNPTISACTVAIRLYDGKSQPVGNLITSTLAGPDNALKIPVEPFTLPAGGYLQAKATLSVAGQTIAQVWSAPILVYPTSTGYFQTYRNSNLRTEYYSIPADMALPGTVHLAVQVASGGTTATAKITPPSGDPVRLVDLLHDSREVYIFGSQGPYSITVPTGKVIFNTTITEPDKSVAGYYVARVIDSRGRVGYSAPVIIP